MADDSSIPKPLIPPEEARRRPQNTEVEFRPQRPSGSSRKRRNRHSDGKPEHSYWQFGAGIVPPFALIGVTLSAFASIRPDVLGAPVVKLSLLGVAGVIAIGLGTIFYGMNPSSRRLTRRDVWIALICGFLTLATITGAMLRSRFLPPKTQSSGQAE